MRTLFHTPIRAWGALCLVLTLACTAWSCSDASSELPEKPEMSFSGKSILFSEEGGERSVSFTTNRAWTAQLINNLDAAQQPWCTLSVESGGAGSHRITIEVQPLEGDYREAILILNASAAGGEITVMQSGQPVLTTADAVAVDESAATLGGSWIYSGELDVAEFGVGIRKQTEAEYTYHAVAERAEDGSFSARIGELESQTTYLFAVYVLTADGVRYTGEEKEFTTDMPPVRISIAELKAAGRLVAEGGQQTLTESQYVEGVVIASFIPEPEPEPTPEPEPEAATRALVSTEAYVMIVDDTASDSGITLYFDTPEENIYALGDRLNVRTKDGVIRHAASGLVDLRPLTIGIRVVESGQSVEPVVIDHTKLADYESMAVCIEHTQLTRLFTDTELYPTWGSATLWNMEVEESEVSYSLYVPAESELAAQTPSSGSGTLRGIVIGGDANDYVVRCDEPSDVAGLTGARFESMLELKFLAPEYQGTLSVGEAATGDLVIPYRNGDNSVIPGTIRAEVTGDPAVVGDLSVASVSDVQIGTGTGDIRLAVSGTPGAAGTVTFTVYGLDALGTANSCTAEVIVPEVPEVGNFEAVWDTATSKGDTQIAGTSTNSSITVTDFVLTASAENISGTKWADFAAVGWDVNTAANKLSSPVQYYLTTLTVGSGKLLALSGMDIEQRINGGDVTLSVQYALNGGAYTEIEAILLTSSSEPFTVNLGKVPALKSLAEGTTVTIRLVPIATNASTKWGIKKGSRLAIYGNAE